MWIPSGQNIKQRRQRRRLSLPRIYFASLFSRSLTHTLFLQSCGFLSLLSYSFFVQILSDIVMPLADGFTFARLLREHERKVGTRPVPLVALTANALKADVDAYTAASFRWFVPKPFRKADLTGVLHTVLAEQIDDLEARRAAEPKPAGAAIYSKRADFENQEVVREEE